MTRVLASLFIGLTLLCSAASAHEGHVRKIMGTVTMAAANHVMIRSTAGRDHTITLKRTTKILRGTKTVTLQDLKEGMRVVITATGDKEPYDAKEIKLGITAKPVSLGPNLKQFENLQFSHSNVKPTLLDGGKAAYVTSEYALKAKMGARDVDTGGLETLVLVQDATGAWKIRHSHTSARRRAPAGAL